MAEEPDARAGDHGRKDGVVDLPERQRERRERQARDRADPGDEAVHIVEKLTMFITATIQMTVSSIPTQAGRSTTPTNGKVKWSIQTPNAHGMAAAATWPASFGSGSSPGSRRRRPRAGDRRAQDDPTHIAREVEEREGGRQDPEEDRQPAEARDRPLVQPPLVGLVDHPEQARHPPDRRRQHNDDREGDQRAPQELGVRPEVVEHR